MGKKNDSGVKTVWNEHNIPIFCDLCINEVEAGRRPTTYFENEGWESLRINFAKETGQELSKSQLKNKWDVLKEQWKYWKELKGKETGLGWNPKLGTVDASNDWWQSKIQDCIGAIDGVHVHASIPPQDQVPYIGWEDTAHDTRVFMSVLQNDALNFPKPPNGKYYLVDAGYPQMIGYLGPYKGERYHLPDFRRGSQPRGSREIFNHAHSSLRSVIERTFGVWKRRWKILRDMPNYSFTKQVKIVIATMALHNYIRRHANRDIHFNESEDDPNDIVSEEADQTEDYHITQGSGAQEMEQLRNNIATSLIRASI